MEQSSGRSWVFVVVSREVWGLRDGTPTNKKKHQQTRKNTNKQGKTPTNKGKHQQTRENTNKQEKTPTNKKKTPTNKKKHQQTRETPFEQGKRLSNKRNTFQARKRLSSKGYLPIKCKSLQVVGVSRQGKAVVSDGGYGVIGG